MQNIKLNTGAQIPQVGFGTWKITDESECLNAVKTALQTGYRHFDTAQVYKNEEFVGEALKKSNIPRKDLFITTKIWTGNFLGSRVTKSFDVSLQKLGTDYVDLLLLHFPVPALRSGAWKKLEEIHKQGRAKAIGVSNYTIRHLEALLKTAKIVPAVNQVELHVFLQQPELVAYCKKHGIVTEAYSPLAHGHGLNNTMLREIAKKHSKTPAQIMLRWCIEVGTVPLPKSVTPSRIAENADIFDFSLDKADMQKLATLEQNLRTCWDPTHIP